MKQLLNYKSQLAGNSFEILVHYVTTEVRVLL